MKKLFAFLLPLLLGLVISLSFSCRITAQPLLPNTDNVSLAGNWVLVPILTSDTITGKIPFINFNWMGKRFTGFTGCNQISGRFVHQGNKLSFNQQLVVTKMVCQGYNEKQFIVNLLRVTDYKIENGILILMYGSTPLSKWMRKTSSKTL